MLPANRTLMRAQQPALEERCDHMNPWQQLGCRFLLPFQERDAVTIALPFQRIVSGPAVGVDLSARFNGLLDKWHETLGRGICNAPHANAPDPLSVFLCSNDNQRLVLGLPPSNPFLFAAPVGLVHFHPPSQAIPARSNHGAPQLVQPSPGGIIAAQAQPPLDSDGTRTILLARDRPHGPKPKPQRFARVLEDRPGRHRTLSPAPSALQQNPTHWPALPSATLRTPKTIGPPQLYQIFPAAFFRREACLKFGQMPWIVL